ncbi:MAG: alpha/beta hydrolase, partial [Ignavibacteria bacterium]|nr:alpha/beta hydrolase [Ignavibacteria bacterium]
MKKYIILICILYFTNCLISKGSGSYTQTDFWLTLSDGVRLDCSKFIPNDNPPAGGYPVAVICHGFGLTKYYEMPTAEKFADSGYYAVVYSMRGQGISEGMSNFISLTEANDLKQLITYIKNDANTNDDKIFVNGGSQGGIVPFMAVCTGLNIKTLITDLASPSAGSNWIENGGIKMTLLWSTSYNNTIVRYNPTVSRFRSWILANTKEKWDSLTYYLPQNRDFINLVENCQIPIFTENAWQDKFFNTYGMIQSAYILPYNNIKMYFGAMDGHGSDYIQEEEDYKDEVLNDWLEYHIDGIQNGVMDASTKFTYVSSKFPVSESKWEWQRNFSPTWPPAGTENIKLYFHPGNTLQVYGYTGNFNEIAYNNDILDPNVSMNYLVNTEFRGPLFEAKFRKNVVNFDTPV